MKYTEQERDEARATLREILNPKSQVFASVRHVSRSGMSRVISFWTPVIREDGGVWMRWLDWDICRALDYSFSKRHEGVSVSGGGMDMGFAVLYDLCYALWGREAGEGWDNLAQKKEWL